MERYAIDMANEPKVVPTVSRTLEDGSLVELVYDRSTRSTALATAGATGTRVEASIELPTGERLVPYSPENSLIAAECILLPAGIEEVADKAAVLDRVRSFIRRYVDIQEPFDEVAAHYVLLSWVYDAFSDLPYLRFRGDFGTGKTRALLTVGSLCYKPFFASGASTVSPVFHILDAFQGTLVLDEADFRFSDAAAQLAKILNNGTTRGMPVLRTMTNRNRELNPQAFRVFGPKVIAMREHFSDLALESRFITVETSGRAPRADVPIHLPDTFAAEALSIRNALLTWRFRSRFSVGPDPSRAVAGVAPRYRQTSLALLSLVDDADLRQRIGRELAGEEARGLQERADTLEAAMLSAILDAFTASEGPSASLADIAVRFNKGAAEELGRAATNRWVGGFVRKRLRLITMKTNGVFVVPRSELPRAKALAARFGVDLAA